MISNENKKLLESLLYFTPEGTKRALNAVYKAMQDGSLRLVWQGNKFLIVSPLLVWATDEETNIDIQSNVNWTIV